MFWPICLESLCYCFVLCDGNGSSEWLKKIKSRKWSGEKAYGSRSSQAVPHPNTIQARRCLTYVIRRDRAWSYQNRCVHPGIVVDWFNFLRLLFLCYVSAHLPGVFVLLFRALWWKGEQWVVEENEKVLKVEMEVVKKPKAPGIPRLYPIQVLSRPDDA